LADPLGLASKLGRAGCRRVNPADLAGPYAFQLTGSTEIPGTPKLAVSLGRISFDERGNLSGTASATFRGLLPGNPMTGSYEAKSDCSVTWKLQDDSGGVQSFSGTLSSDGTSVPFKQTDPGAAQHGIMKKIPGACSVADLGQKYSYTVSGSTTPMLPGQVPHAVSAKGTLDIAGNGRFRVESDCSVTFGLTLPPGRSGGRPTFAHEYAWISGQRRQGNPRLPDRSGSRGVGTPQLRRKVTGIGASRAPGNRMNHQPDESMRTYGTVSAREKGTGPGSAGQSGDTQGLSDVAEAGSESVVELVEEGQSFEAEAIEGVEDAPDGDVAEVHTKEVPQDDVPSEYQGQD
jgi:hypothetical protein